MLIGVIRNISTFTAMLDLFVFEDGIAVCRGASLKDLASRIAGEAVGGHVAGAAGFDAAIDGSNRRDAIRTSFMGAELTSLLARHPGNRFIPAASIAAARLKTRWDGSTRLELDMADGTRSSFTWKKVYGNEPAEVERMLVACLGSRLSKRM